MTPRLVLTFDDGPGPSTPALLDALAEAGVSATLFVLGKNLETRRDVAERAVREGHTLGNHTYSHARPEQITSEAFLAEVAHVDALLAALQPGVPPVRLPYGVVGESDHRLAALASIGRPHVGWTADFGDWEPCDPVELASRMRAHVTAQHARGEDAVLDLHDSSKLGAERSWTVEAVREWGRFLVV